MAKDMTICASSGLLHTSGSGNRLVMSNSELVIISRGNPNNCGEEICTSATSCTRNVTLVHPGLNFRLCGETQPTTAFVWPYNGKCPS
jgi:hypothetical protein